MDILAGALCAVTVVYLILILEEALHCPTSLPTAQAVVAFLVG